MYIARSASLWVKMKESKNRENYLDLAGELRKLRNMRVTVIPSGIGALGTISKVLSKRQEKLEIGGRIEIQTTELLRSARILRIVLETVKDHQLKLVWKILKEF